MLWDVLCSSWMWFSSTTIKYYGQIIISTLPATTALHILPFNLFEFIMLRLVISNQPAICSSGAQGSVFCCVAFQICFYVLDCWVIQWKMYLLFLNVCRHSQHLKNNISLFIMNDLHSRLHLGLMAINRNLKCEIRREIGTYCLSTYTV